MGQPSTQSMPGCLALLQGAVQHPWEELLSQLLLPLWHPVLMVEDSNLPFPPLCAVFHPSSEDHLLLVSNPRLCLGMDTKGSPGSSKAFFPRFKLEVIF